MKKITFTLVLLSFILPGITFIQAQNISTIAGCGIGDDSVATKAELWGVAAITQDNKGNTYIADAGNNLVRKIDNAGVITTFAGNGVYGYSGDGGAATSASIGVIYGVALDKHGNVYIVDQAYSVIRKIDTAGIITTIAGTGINGYTGDGGPATTAKLNNPIDIVIDANDNIIFTDWQNAVVRKIDTAGIITTIVGDGHTGGTGIGGLATASELGAPFRVALDKMGNLYVAEVIYQAILKVDTAGIITRVAGTGVYGIGSDGDGGLATAATMSSPCGLALDTSGNLYFSDIDNNRIREVNLNTGIISNYAGTSTGGYSGDGGAATSAQISVPEGLFCDGAGDLFICDAANNKIREVNYNGTITSIAGQNEFFDDGYTATHAELGGSPNMAIDGAGNVYLADIENSQVRKINVTTGVITTVAGTGLGSSGLEDGGPADSANVGAPYGVAVDGSGNIYIADQGNNRIRKVDTAGNISTFAGSGAAGYMGDGGAAVHAKFRYPYDVAVDTKGNVYIADYANSVIRKVNNTGTISTVAGIGAPGYSGDSGLATVAKLYYPTSVAVDGWGNIYIADGNAIAGGNPGYIRKVDTEGIITTITSAGAAGFSGDGGPSTAAQVNRPSGLKVDRAGNLLFADNGNNCIRKIDTGGIIHTVAGNETAGFSGDGGVATAAKLNSPSAAVVDQSGNMYIDDAGNFRVRKVNLAYLSVPTTEANNNLRVYPNPTHNQLFLSTDANVTGNDKITLLNAIGQQVYSAPFLINNQAINMANLASGEYLLLVTGKNGSQQVVKVTKE